jgi:hypothetical protein
MLRRGEGARARDMMVGMLASKRAAVVEFAIASLDLGLDC